MNKPAQEHEDLIAGLRRAAGRRNVSTGLVGKAPYCHGIRFGRGNALAVVRPGTLTELWDVLELCVAADTAIVMQAANTGLTGGSTPLPEYDRPAVVVSTLRIDRIVPIVDGRQVVCYAGATLQALEDRLRNAGRLPHSVLGSSCIGASVIGGVCNNSGGALVERGPAYTELALYARVTSAGRLELVNELGIHLGDSTGEILRRLDACVFDDRDVSASWQAASAFDYSGRVRDTESSEPARYNADASRLHGASGCAGKVAVFAVRLDTFEAPGAEQTFYLASSDPGDLARLRRDLLTEAKTLPVSAEYIHRDTLELTLRYGNDTVWLIERLGTRRIPGMFRARSRLEAILGRIAGLPSGIVDRGLQLLCRLLPPRLPERVVTLMGIHEHHMILKCHDGGIAEAERLLETIAGSGKLRWFRCTAREAAWISLYRFAAAGAATRFAACHQSSADGIVSLDVALPRNAKDWFDCLPAGSDRQIRASFFYGHFLCHVFHLDYVVEAGEDPETVKAALLERLEARGVRYPAEHSHGQMYKAPPELEAFYKALDPTNSLNPGVGRTSSRKYYA